MTKGVVHTLDYSYMYRRLLAAQDDAIRQMNNIIEGLIEVHREMEEIYIGTPHHKLFILNKLSDKARE